MYIYNYLDGPCWNKISMKWRQTIMVKWQLVM